MEIIGKQNAQNYPVSSITLWFNCILVNGINNGQNEQNYLA